MLLKIGGQRNLMGLSCQFFVSSGFRGEGLRMGSGFGVLVAGSAFFLWLVVEGLA